MTERLKLAIKLIKDKNLKKDFIYYINKTRLIDIRITVDPTVEEYSLQKKISLIESAVRDILYPKNKILITNL